MPDVASKKRTWLGLVCPVCRFVFRVPRDHGGAGVVCPACNHLLNLPQGRMVRRPAAEEPREPVEPVENTRAVSATPRDKRETKPIVARPLTEEDKLPETPRAKGQRRQKRKRTKGNRDKLVQWDQAESVQNRGDGSPVPWIAGGSLLGLLVAGAGAWLVLDSLDKEKADKPTSAAHLPSLTASDLEKETVVELSHEEKMLQEEISESVKTGMNVLTEAEAVVRKFMNASSLEEMAKYVRTPETTVPRMREWYKGSDWKPIGVKEVGAGGRVTVKGTMASMAVKLPDFTLRQIALARVGNAYKVDWESWVGWSSIPWDDLFEKKPEQAVELRAKCSLDTYYNRHFRDDKKWIAVRLVHPLKDRILYGYIDRDSPALTRLAADLQGSKSSAATIRVRFPKGSAADNQVEITEYLQNGWVRPAADGQQAQPNPASP